MFSPLYTAVPIVEIIIFLGGFVFGMIFAMELNNNAEG